MTMTRRTLYLLTQGAVIAAVYAVLTVVCWTFSSMGIQVRISEGLCILPLFTNAAVPGLYIGCVIANLIAGNFIDAIFGGLATLIAALLTYLIGRKLKGKMRVILAPLPAVIVNALVIPFVIYFGYSETEFMGQTGPFAVLALLALSIFIGQAIACYGIGVPLYFALKAIDDRIHVLSLSSKVRARKAAAKEQEQKQEQEEKPQDAEINERKTI